jgi:hypothetical protein
VVITPTYDDGTPSHRIPFPSILLRGIDVLFFIFAVQLGDLCWDRADGREIGGVYKDHEGYD